VTAPLKLIFVAYPATIVRHSLRKVQRVDYPLFAEVEINNEQFEGLIKDISARGCRLSIVANSASHALPSLRDNQMLSVRCALPGIETHITITGQVKSFDRKETRATIGIAFHDIDPDVRDKLARFMSSIHKIL
jgi:c-di-GMP-binding flagellar brake protein YcgR